MPKSPGPRPSYRRFLLAAALLLPHAPALALALTWDSSGSNPNSPVAGPGTWDTTTPRWSNTFAIQPWTDAADATFAGTGTGGLITINDPSLNINANSLTFLTDGYSL